MFSKMLKIINPTSLYARGLLMILAPVLALQVIIGTLVVQRYFFGVIGQLDGMVIENITFAKNMSKNDTEYLEILQKMGYRTIPNKLTANRYEWFDISGRIIRGNFAKNFGEPVYIESDNWGRILLTLPKASPPLNLTIDRSKLAPINPHQILINMLGSSFLLALVSILFLRNQVRSLQKLSHAAKAFGRGETVNYAPSGGDEVRSAGLSFLAMRNRIIRQREQRNLMLSGVSHDLRTPLTRMRLSVAMLDDEDQRLQLSHDITAIEELADSFLNYAANDAAEEFKTVNLNIFIKDLCSKFPMVEMKDSVRIDARIRPVLLRRGIENLLNNAQRYGSKIEVSLQETSRVIHIFIDDDGPGIKPEQREDAMKAFTRLDPARNQNEGGHVGLGMAIAADAVRQHGGDISLDVSPLGGLRVKITLPVKLDA